MFFSQNGEYCCTIGICKWKHFIVLVILKYTHTCSSELLARGLCGPLGCCGPACLTTTSAYSSPPLAGLSCWLPLPSCLPVEPWAADQSLNRCPGGGWRLAGSEKPFKTHGETWILANTLFWHSKVEALIVLAFEAARAFFFPAAMAFLSSWRKTDKSSILDIAIAKGYFLLPQHCATTGAHIPLTLLHLICSSVRGSTPIIVALLSLSAE